MTHVVISAGWVRRKATEAQQHWQPAHPYATRLQLLIEMSDVMIELEQANGKIALDTSDFELLRS